MKNPDHCYYLSFALLQLNTDLHRDEVKKKMTLEEFIKRLNEQTGEGNGSNPIDEKYAGGEHGGQQSLLVHWMWVSSCEKINQITEVSHLFYQELSN